MAADQNDDQTLLEHKAVVYTLPCVLAVVCYLNGLQGQFVHDDIFAISGNPDVTGANPVLDVFTNDFWGKPMTDVNSHKSYRPLCVLTFRWDYYISGGNPGWFHGVNTLLHVLVTLTFTLVCARALHTSLTCALLAGCLFAVHPIHTEAVTGIVGRAEVLTGLFFLLSFYAFSRCVLASPSLTTRGSVHKLATREPATREPATTELLRSQAAAMCLSLPLSAVAMLCKETGVTTLGVSLLFDLLHSGKNLARDMRRRQLSTAGSLFLARSICLVLAAALLLLLRFWIMDFDQPQVFPEESNPAWASPSRLTRFLTFTYLPTFNFWLLLCPARLSYDWTGRSIPLLESLGDHRNLASLAFYTGAATLLITCLRKAWQTSKAETPNLRNVTLLTSTGILTLPFLPASNLFFKVGFVVAERVLYIPSMGYCLLVAHGFLAVSARMQRARSRLLTAYLLVLLALALRTLDRNQVWQSRRALFWSGARTLSHNDKVHYNLANLLKDEGRLLEAEDHYRTAIGLNPGIASYHLNLGTVLTNKTESRLCYLEALRLRPQHVGALVNLGSLLVDQGDQSGISLIQEALALEPNHLEAVLAMAQVLLLRGDLTQAGRYSTQAVQIRPDSSKAHLYHGIYLHNSGQTESALHEYETAARLNPQDTNALVNSARIYFSSGQLNEASSQLERAVTVTPDCSECLALLGSVYSRQGKGQHAVITLGRASSLAPNNTHTNLKYVQALKESKQSDKAWSVLQDLMRRVPGHLDVLKFGFTLAMEEKRYSQALPYIQEMITVTERTGGVSLADLYRDQGNAHRHNNDPTSALKSLEKAIETNLSFVDAIIDAGSVHFLQKNFAAAESYYQRALELDGSNRLARSNLDRLGRVLAQSGGRLETG